MPKTSQAILNKYELERKRSAKANPNATFESIMDNIGGIEVVEEIKEHINYIIYVVNDQEISWTKLKDMIANYMPNKYGYFFSKKDSATKKQKPNDFDYAVINYWYQETGKLIVIPKHKLHPENHVYRPKGWNIVVLNELKRRKAIAEGRMEPSESKYSKKLGSQKRRGRPDGYNIYTTSVTEYFENLDKAIDQGNDNS